MKRIFLFSALTLLLLFTYSCKEQSNDLSIDLTEYETGQLSDSINSFLEPIVKNSYSPSDTGMFALSVYLMKDENILVDTNYFFSNLDSIELNDSTIFQLGSVTKTFTAALVAKQVNNGNMNLDSSAQSYLPNTSNIPYPILPMTYKNEPVKITMSHLASMSSGLARNVVLPSGQKSSPYLSGFEWIDSCKLTFPPSDTCNAYSNLGFSILGLTLCAEAYPGTEDYYNNYEDVVVDSLLSSLNMNDTRINLSPEQLGRRAPGYRQGGSRAPYQSTNWPMNLAAGGLYSTINDMKIYANEMIGEGNFLSDEDIDTLIYTRGFACPDTCSVDRDTCAKAQAMAWVKMKQVYTQNKERIAVIGKDGGLPGTSTYIAFSTPEINNHQYKAYVVLLCNKQGITVWPYSRTVMQYMFDLADQN